MDKIRTLLNEMRIELLKVSWPKKEELIGSTWVVLVGTVILAIVIGIIDIMFTHMMGGIIR